MFGSLEAEDRSTFDALITDDFRAFEGGVTFDRASFFGLVYQAHRSGKRFHWSVTDSRILQSSDVAVINYVNEGEITEAGKTQRMTWLEVASLRADPQGWKVNFMASQSVGTPAKGE